MLRFERTDNFSCLRDEMRNEINCRAPSHSLRETLPAYLNILLLFASTLFLTLIFTLRFQP